MRVVVGLGNPGGGYGDTPHNVGHRVLDLLAGALGARGRGSRARRWRGWRPTARSTYLVKPAARMNVAGPALVRDRPGAWAFGSPDLVLVHDDLDLPVGSVRVRTRSSDGGHRGVRSVFQAFRTDEIRRVRVGVGRPAPGQPVEEFVLTPLPPDDRRRPRRGRRGGGGARPGAAEGRSVRRGARGV